jgi:hypothetical protein
VLFIATNRSRRILNAPVDTLSIAWKHLPQKGTKATKKDTLTRI